MTAFLVLGISIVLQFWAAVLALWQVRTTRMLIGWTSIAIAITLMAFRRLISFHRVVAGDPSLIPDLPAELVALLTSILMVIGISSIGNIFRAIQKANERLTREIRQREAAEEALKESEHRYRQLVELSPDGIFVDVGDRVVFANNAAARILGKTSPDELMGTGVLDVVQPDQSKTAATLTEEGAEETTVAPLAERSLIRADGSEVDIEVTHGSLQYKGKQAVQVVMRDVTHRKKAEKLVLQNERLKAVADLATGVAHNFNNLLQIVMSAAELALRQVRGGKIEAATSNLNCAIESARLGSGIVRRLQSFAALRNDRVPSDGEVFDLSATVRHAIAMSKVWWGEEAWEGSESRIVMMPSLQEGCTLKGSEGELFDVAINLIKNAVESLPDGGEIRVRTYRKNASVFFEVQDNGVGIPPENLEHIFEPFFTTKGFQTAGMGLSSSYGTVSRHGGEIAVESKPGDGSCFTVKLPFAPANSKEKPVA